MTTFAAADSLIREHVRNGWTACPLVEGIGPDTEIDPPAPFAKLFISGARGEFAWMGGGVKRGITARLVVFATTIRGEATINALAGEVIPLLSNREIVSGTDHVRFDPAEIGEVVPADDAGAWLSVTVTARGHFFAQER